MVEMSHELREDIMKDFLHNCTDLGLDLTHVGTVLDLIRQLLATPGSDTQVALTGINMLCETIYEMNRDFVSKYHATSVALGFLDEDNLRKQIESSDELSQEQKNELLKFIDSNREE